MERFLTIAAEDNIQIVYPSTPAQYFHCLRRQVLRRWRKPLVIFTPKSLLRHSRVVSELRELSQGRFLRVLPDDRKKGVATTRVLLCTGKIYYELLEARQQRGAEDMAIIRLEQLYPLPALQLRSALERYDEGTKVIWVQEEPENMGAWRYLRICLGEQLFELFPFKGITRTESASPATGSPGSHKMEQRQLINRAFGESA
jgi:2-oxoglutarate dehydrogenase E1 component